MLGEANKLENLNTYKMTDFTSKVETLNLILVSSIECGLKFNKIMLGVLNVCEG